MLFFFDVVWIPLFCADACTLSISSRPSPTHPHHGTLLFAPSADLEPTSALDPETTLAVEKYTVSALHRPDSTVKAIIWITHSEEQGQRVGTRFVTVAAGRVCEEPLAVADLV